MDGKKKSIAGRGGPQSALVMKHPVAPAVYRPQPVPKVLQRQTAAGQSPKVSHASGSPVAPPVYRPQIKPPIAQRKTAGAAQLRTPPLAPPVYRPPAKPSAVQQKSPRPTNAVVQRYSVSTIKELGGVGKLSENSNYFIPNSSAAVVYAETSAKAPLNSKKDGGPIAANSTTYQGYVSKKFLRDCLHTAEEIINQKKLKPGVDVYSKVAGTSEPFGDEHADNIRLAQTYAADNKAAPGLGQAYVIVNKNWVTPSAKKRKRVDYPYHAAGVVAVDGTDRITLEVCATGQDAKARDTDGEYYMYSTTGSGDTFHSHWQKTYFGKDSATLVIERK